jgi:hypothetical protein
VPPREDKREGREVPIIALLPGEMESSVCHTERRKDKGEGREVTIIDLLADMGRWKALCATQREGRIRERKGGNHNCFVSWPGEMESSMCNIERRKYKREGPIIALLADLGRWKALCATQREEMIREREGR